MLIYNYEFDHTRWTLGLKYNQTWMMELQQPVLFDPKRRPLKIPGPYRTLLPFYEAVIEDWRNCRAVDGLSVTIPEATNWQTAGPMVEDPLVVNFNDIAIYLVPYDELDNVFHRRHLATFIRFDRDGVTICAWEDLEDPDVDPELTCSTLTLDD